MFQVARPRGLAKVNWAGRIASRPSGAIGTSSLYATASPAITAADLNAHASVTVEGGYPVLIEPDGDPVIDSGGDVSRQSFAFDLYIWLTDSLESYTGWINNSAPSIDPDVLSANFEFTNAINAAMVDFDASALFIDLDDTTLTYSITAGTLPTGTSLNTSTGHITGTPTAYGWPNLVTITATDIAGATASAELSQYVGDEVPDVSTDTQAAGTAELEGVGFTVAEGTSAYSSTIDLGDIISTTPVAGSVAEHGSEVEIVVSLGQILTDQLQTIFLDAGTPVPATAVFRAGLAYAHTGELYVAYLPAQAVWVSGLLCRADGALIIVADGTVVRHARGGIGVDSQDAIVASYAQSEVTHNEWPMLQDGTVCMSDVQ